MSIRMTSLALAATLLAAGCSQPDQGDPAVPVQAAQREDAIVATAKVENVNQQTREVTLRGADGSILGTGTVEERASFNFGDAAYGDLAAQTAAQERLATLLARSIRAEMIIAGGKVVDPKTGKPVVAKAEPAAPAAAPKPTP